MASPKTASLQGLLPSQPELKLRQAPGKLKSAALKATEHLLVVIPEKAAPGVWQQLPDGKRLKSLSQKRKLSSSQVVSRLNNAAQTGITLQSLPGVTKTGPQPGTFDLLSFAGKLVARALADNPASIAIAAVGFDKTLAEEVIRALILALGAHRFAMPSFKSDTPPAARLRSVQVLGLDERIDLQRTATEAHSTNLARWLTHLPPNKLDAATYRSILQALAKEHGWKMEFLDEKKLHKAGAGAFLAVAQGNATQDAGIARLSYTPSGNPSKDAPPLALVGKGIIFDTGGTNLKPFNAMLDMHHDMAGSAVALATLLALSELGYPGRIDCWLALTENRISNKAYKSRDIVTAANGVTIEVIHTDAEGRMALADTLALAGQKKPHTIIDFATLTGTCVSALTDRYSGAFTNRENLNSAIIAAGKASGERVWPFPLDADFDEEIKSQVADVLQCAAAGGGDHIQAARFLQRFVPTEADWVHVDLSAASRKGGLAQIPTEVTGFGVRFALNLILDQHTATADEAA